MTTLLAIFADIVLPIFFLIAIGFAVQRWLGLEMRTLSRLNFYVFVPALIFVKFSQADLLPAQLGVVSGFTALMIGSLFSLCWLIGRWRGYDRSVFAAFATSTMFYNSGNYGLPLIELVFASPLATAVQTVVLSTQNLLNFTAGLLLVFRGRQESTSRPAPRRLAGGLLRQIGKFPFLYALGLALLFKGVGWQLWSPAWTALEQLSHALVPVALVTLGAQLATTRWNGRTADIALAAGVRLIAGPVLGLAFVALFDIGGLMAQALILSTAVPTAVNVVLMAIEFDNQPDFVSQAVFISTLASALTVSLVIYGIGAR